MPGVNVEIKPDILLWVINKIQFSDTDGELSGQLKSWLSGEKTPTFSQIEKISRKTRIPFGYFFLNVPPKDGCEIVDFRTVDSIVVQNPSRELIDTVDAMSAVQEWMAENNKINGLGKYPYVGKFSDSSDVPEMTADIRHELRLTEDWYKESHGSRDSFRNIRKAASDSGILIMMSGVAGNNNKRKLNAEEFRAFTLIDPYAPLIFINAGDTDNAKIFSLAHEIAHVWIGRNSLFNEPYANSREVSRKEQICNAVAAELLVPEQAFIESWKNSEETGLSRIREMAELFSCSRYVIARRALTTEKITRSEYSAIIKKLNEEQTENKGKKGSGGNYYRTLQSRWDRNFILALNESVKSGKTQYSEAYHMTNTRGGSFSELVRRFGGEA